MSNYLTDGYHRDAAAYAPENARVGFIRRTYLHLAGSVAALVGDRSLAAARREDRRRPAVPGRSGSAARCRCWLILALFIAGGFLARYMARADMPAGGQVPRPGLYTVIEALFLLPILYVATTPEYGMGIVNQAAILTLITFGGLTLTVFMTRARLLRPRADPCVASLAMLGVIVGGIHVRHLALGLWISFVCIALAAGYILYDTSNILHHYATDEHVGASLELLADVVLLFYHILRVLMLTRDD